MPSAEAMRNERMDRSNFNRAMLLLVVVGISVLFFLMIRDFLMAILMAGIFSALSRPLYSRFKHWFKGRQSLASLVTLVVILLVIIIPLGGFLGIVAAQALEVGESVTPWIQRQLSEPTGLSSLLEKLPFYEQIAPYRDQIMERISELVGSLSNFLIKGLSSVTVVTVNFLLKFFIFLYTTYFFLIDGNKLLDKILYYLPLEDKDERRMLEKFTSVTRATLKGTAVIGVIQGTLAGLAFAVVGIPSSIFWGTIMMVLSVIPSIGAGLVWIPAAIILMVNGHLAKGIGLAIFCGIVVGSCDNLLRPRLVGKDTKMPELLIFFGTLGGIVFFGVLGFIIGPIIAALFVTVWEIYGEVFRHVLPTVRTPETEASGETQSQPESFSEADSSQTYTPERE